MAPIAPPRTRFRHSNRALSGPTLPLAILAIAPIVLMIGLAVAVPRNGTSAPSFGPPPGIRVSIEATFTCVHLCAPLPYTLRLSAVVRGTLVPDLYLWTFGDGSTPAYGQNVTHTFPNCDSYVVTVWVAAGIVTGSNSTTVRACAG